MRTSLILIASLILTSTYGQTRTSDNCFTNNNPKTKVTRQTYPFSKAEKILIVKYKAAAVQGKPNIFSWDTVSIIPKNGDKIDTTQFVAKKQLTNKGVDSLLKIINQRSKDNPGAEGIVVEPSNAILFIDKKGNIFEYIVICFAQVGSLRDYTPMSNSTFVSVYLGGWCNQKGQLLTDFFLKRGVDIVVTKWE